MKIAGWLASGLGTLLAALSFAVLASTGFHSVGSVSALAAFDSVMRTIFQPLDSSLTIPLGWIGARIGHPLRLSSDWKYAFVPLWLYFASLASVWWKAGGRGAAVFSVVWGGAVALGSALAFGVVGIDASNTQVLPNALLGAVPLAAYALFALGIGAWAATFLDREGRSWASAFASWSGSDLGLAAIGLVLLLVAIGALEVSPSFPDAGLALAGAFVVLLALYLIGVGIRDVRHLRTEGESWLRAFARLGSPQIGLFIVAGIGAAVLMLALGSRLGAAASL